MAAHKAYICYSETVIRFHENRPIANLFIEGAWLYIPFDVLYEVTITYLIYILCGDNLWLLMAAKIPAGMRCCIAPCDVSIVSSIALLPYSCVYIYVYRSNDTLQKKKHAGLTKSKLGSHRPLLRRCHARPFGLRHVDVVGGPGACTNDCSGSMKYNRGSSKTNWVFQTNFLQWNFLKKVEKRVWDQHSSSGDFRLYWWIYIYIYIHPVFNFPRWLNGADVYMHDFWLAPHLHQKL